MHEEAEIRPDPPPDGAWTDEQLARTASEVYFELPDVTFADVAEATKQCRFLVPVSAGLPALRHGIKERALDLRVGNRLSPNVSVTAVS